MGRALLCVLAVAPVALSARADDTPKVATFGQKNGGLTVSLAEGDYNLSDMNAAGLGNDAIISVKVTPGYKVIGSGTAISRATCWKSRPTATISMP